MSKLSETFTALRQANIQRLPLFKNKHGAPAHSQPDGSDWSDAEWFQAVIGELGEYANIRKKLQRGDYTREEALPMLADELADVATYIDILAFRVGTNLGEMLRLNHTPTWGAQQAFSDAEWVQVIVEHLGHWSSAKRNATGIVYVGAFEIVRAVMCLNELANQLGIDLPDAIVSKFNRVSERVGCDVRLGELQ